MITRILNQLVGARTLQYHTVAIKHEVNSILKLTGFVVHGETLGVYTLP